MEAPVPNPTHCAICFCAIRRYKTWRDWKGRPSHYSCYKKKTREDAIQFMYDDFVAEQAAR